VTPDEVCAVMATKGVKTKEEWADFFAMSPELQEVEARLIKNAIWVKQGPSAFEQFVADFGLVATLAADVSGVGSALIILKNLL
jgi:hypothetical protein